MSGVVVVVVVAAVGGFLLRSIKLFVVVAVGRPFCDLLN